MRRLNPRLALLGIVSLALGAFLCLEFLPDRGALDSDPHSTDPDPVPLRGAEQDAAPGEKRQAIATPTKPAADKKPHGTLDLTLRGLPNSPTRWLQIEAEHGRRVRGATPEGSFRCKLALTVGEPRRVYVDRTWLRSAPPCFFAKFCVGKYTLRAGEVKRVIYDFASHATIAGKLLGRHGTRRATIAAQFELPAKTPGGAPERRHFSLCSNDAGEFKIFGMKEGTLFLFHHSAFPRNGLGPKLLDATGADRWRIPRSTPIEVQTKSPLHGVRYVHKGRTVTIEEHTAGFLGMGTISTRQAIHVPSLEQSGMKVIRFLVPGHGRFEHPWRDLEITESREFVVPLPGSGGTPGTLVIGPASETERKRREREQRGGGIRPWSLVATSADGQQTAFYCRHWKHDLPPGTYRLVWKQGARLGEVPVATPATVRSGQTTRIALDMPRMVSRKVTVTNWASIPAAHRPDQVLAPPNCAATLDEHGNAELDLPEPLPDDLDVRFLKTATTGSLTAQVRPHADRIELRFPASFGFHQLRLKPRLGGKVQAYVARSPRGAKSGTWPDARGWLQVYTTAGERRTVVFVENYSFGAGNAGAVVRGATTVAGLRSQRAFDFGGRMVEVELGRGTVHASGWIELRGDRAPARWYSSFRQNLSQSGKFFVPDDAATVLFRVENQSPRTYRAEGLTGPLRLER